MSIKQWVITKLGIVGQFLSVLFKDAMQKELSLILPIAAKVVAQIAQDASILTSDQKRRVAIENIQNEVVNAQMNIGLSVISLAIELAVQQMKHQ